MPTNIDVSALVGDIATETITVRSWAAPSVDAFGQPARATATDVELEAVVHPATPDQLERLPEIDRVRSVQAIYTTTPLVTVATGYGSRVQYADRWYELTEQGDYGYLGGIYLILAARLEEYTEPEAEP